MRLELEPIAVKASFLEAADDVRDDTPGARPVAVHDHEQVDVALAVSVAPGHASEDDDAEQFLDVVGAGDGLPNGPEKRGRAPSARAEPPF